MINEEQLKEKVIENLISNVIDIPAKQVDKIYNKWLSGNIASVIKQNGLSITTINKTSIRDFYSLPNDACLLGVDLPYWKGDLLSANKRIMVIGIDPYRDRTAFINADNADTNNHVLLSTPFAFHVNKESSFKKFINHLADDNYFYLTDVYKVYFSKKLKGFKSYNYYKEKAKQVPQVKEMLFKEIEIVNPHLIITLGNISYNQLTGKWIKLTRNILTEERKYFDGIPLLPLMHFTGCYPHHFKSFLKINNLGSSSISNSQAYSLLVKSYIDRI